jgi:16S rRNA (guanine(966)-N(2))-methyltransferase RsmD
MAARPRAGGAGRVIAGSARGRQLQAPGEGTRPLGDRLKEALFATLEPEIRDRPFLDLFAGSGAAGIEALSRGASRAVFVERDAGAAKVIAANLAATGLADRAMVARAGVEAWLGRDAKQQGPFAAILLDPPYDRPELLEAALRAIAADGPGGILAVDGVAVAKHFGKQTVPAEIGLLGSARERRFGESALTFLRWASAGADDEGEEDR